MSTFHTQTALAQALRTLFQQLEERLSLTRPLNVYLAVSKISRFADNDKEDIASLVRAELVCADDIEQRANQALGDYVGGIAMLKLNLREAVALARATEEAQQAAPSPSTEGPEGS